jgi:hypothetical protein
LDKNREKGMELIPITPAMAAATKDVVTRVVIPSWIKRGGPDAKATFNQYVAPHSGITLP